MNFEDQDPRLIKAEPVSTIIGLTALISGIGVSGAVAGAIGGFIVSTVAAVGLSAAASLLQKRSTQSGFDPTTNTQLNTPEVRYSTRQSAPPKRIIVGTALVGGALAFESVKPPFLSQMFAICADRIAGVRDIFIGTNQLAILKTGTYIPIDSAITPQGNLVNNVISGSPAYSTRLQLCVRVGTTVQVADPLLAARYTSLGSEFRHRGNATVSLEYHYGTDFDEHQALWGNAGQPNPLFLVDGVSIPDPRVSGQILEYDPTDPDSVAAAKATWTFTNTAALVQAWYLTQPFGGKIHPSRINWDRVAYAAEYDDIPIPTLSGTYIRRNTIDGLISLDQNPATVAQGMLTSNRGFIVDSGSRIWVTSARPRDPVVCIHDRLLVGGFEYQAAKPKRDLINTVKTRFIASDREYNLVDGPPLQDDDFIDEDGEILESSPLDLPFISDVRRVERLQKAYLESARLGKYITCRVDLILLAEASDELIGASCVFASSLFSQANGIYLITQVAFAENFAAIDLTMIEYDKDIETNWEFSTDEVPFALPPLNLS